MRVDYVCYFWMFVAWEAGVYEYGSVHVDCWVFVGSKRVYIRMEVFNQRT